MERVTLLHGDRGRTVDGIRDHSHKLAEALEQRGVEVDIRLQQAGVSTLVLTEWWASWRRLRRADASTLVLIQYSPFCFARWGFAPWLPAFFLALRLKRRRPRIAVMVHEPFVPMDSLRWAVLGAWQRLQLAALRLAADMIFTSIEPWATQLAAQIPRRPTRHLPVGSTLPDERRLRERERKRLGVGEETLVVAALGRDHPGWLRDYVVSAVNAIAAAGRRQLLLSLGGEAPGLSGVDSSVRVVAPGYLEADELAGRLAAADLFLAPLVDGVSTRRSSLMAALQHGLPVVGTVGPLTDMMLRESCASMRLVEVGSAERFAAAAAELADEPSEREPRQVAARGLYEERFDWPVISAALLAAFEER